MLPRHALHNPDELAKLDRKTDEIYFELLEQVCRLERRGEGVHDLESALQWTRVVQDIAIKAADQAEQLETLSNQAIWLSNRK